MKKFIFSATLLVAGLGMSAQLVEINSMQRVNLPEGMAVNIPTISPDGSFVVVSDMASSALTKIDITSGATAQVTDNGSGIGVKISTDGSQVVFRQSTIAKNKLRYTSLQSVNLTDGKAKQLVAPSRKLNGGVSITGNTVTAVENNKTRVLKLNGSKEAATPVVSINYGHLEYTNASGKTTTLDPQGRGSYLWPALSPDGTKVVYYLAGGGCFVCNIDGSNPVSLGMLRAATWLNNDVVVGMNDVDNGDFFVSSSIIAADLKGARQTLTEDNIIAMYPTASADGKRIAFATPDGQLFVINLK